MIDADDLMLTIPTRLIVKKYDNGQRGGICEHCKHKIYISYRYCPSSYNYCPYCGRHFTEVVRTYGDEVEEDE